MRNVLIVFLLFSSVKSFAQTLDLDAIRRDFNKGVKDKDLCEKYYNQLKKEAKSPVEEGYEAAFHMFQAKHTMNPIKKMSYFKDGKNMLEKVIDANPNHTELRFIRLCIQFYTPKYLGYHADIDDDKNYVMNNLFKMNDKTTKELIYKYLKGAKMYTEDELELLGR